MAFNKIAAPTSTPLPTPAAVTLVSPTGDIGTNYKPTYTWNKDAGATYYYLLVQNSSTAVIQQWYTAEQASCGVSTCSVTPNKTLPGGTYTWKVQTWSPSGYGAWSALMTFNTTIPPTPTPLPTPDAATLVEPGGDISNAKPTYTWNKVSAATHYYLMIEAGSSSFYQQWYSSSSICGISTCSVTPGKSLTTGSYTWKVLTWNPSGFGTWSTPMAFNKLVPPTPTPLPTPDSATLVSPSSDVTSAKPTYTWNKVSAATYYYMILEGGSGPIYQQWYSSSSACNTSTCSATPNMSLANGAYTWRVQTWGPAGYGGWSAPMAFNKVEPPTPTPLPTPVAVTLVSPTGDIGTNYKPTYTWNKAVSATYYYIVVEGGSGVVYQQWYTASQAACGASTCSVTPNKTLAGGTYTWKVQTWSPAGYGPWSAVSTFNTTIPPTATPTLTRTPSPTPLPSSTPTASATPAPSATAASLPSAASLVGPSGSVTSSNPTYTWRKVTGATQYLLYVSGPSGVLIQKWYTPAQAACGVTTCSVVTGVTHAVGRYTWKVQTWSPAGYGPWSSITNFTR